MLPGAFASRCGSGSACYKGLALMRGRAPRLGGSSPEKVVERLSTRGALVAIPRADLSKRAGLPTGCQEDWSVTGQTLVGCARLHSAVSVVQLHASLAGQLGLHSSSALTVEQLLAMTHNLQRCSQTPLNLLTCSPQSGKPLMLQCPCDSQGQDLWLLCLLGWPAV